jgi:hypothetical protein
MRSSAGFAAVAFAALAAVGCNKTVMKEPDFASAINSYYEVHPACLWQTTQSFPTQVSTSDKDKTAPFDALFDQGMLVRTTAEKKVMIVASKQVTNYDLSPKGKTEWKSDPNQPGYGNFCYGSRKVQGIESVSPSPVSDAPGATASVSYRYAYSNPPAWATAAVMQTAFPDLRSDLAGSHVAQATLANTSNGWAVSNPTGTP